MKTFTEYSEAIAKNTTYFPPNIEFLQRELNSRTAQLSNIRSNYWLIPKNAIKGISGFFCTRCQSFGFEYVKNLGYDMTAQARHVCDENKVKRLEVLLTKNQDNKGTDNFIGRFLLNHVNFFMPGTKYLQGRNVSKFIDGVTSAFSYDIAKEVIGIPDRYGLCELNDAATPAPAWLKKALENPDKKTELKEEVVEFLGMVKSSYSMFEIPTSNPPKMILLALTS
jgi:hypothetical protein